MVDYHALVVLSKHLSYHEFGYIEDNRVGEMWHECYMGPGRKFHAVTILHGYILPSIKFSTKRHHPIE